VTRCATLLWLAVVLGGGFATACGGGRAPDTHYYDLASNARRHAGDGPVLVIEPLSADEPYDDERMVYRENPYRVDFYHYHRWSASPGAVVSRHLERALGASGRFSAVLREDAKNAAYVLGGRLIALEEVDVSRRRWLARVSSSSTCATPPPATWSGRRSSRRPSRSPSSPRKASPAPSAARWTGSPAASPPSSAPSPPPTRGDARPL
jgi:hypothetical protein